MRSKKKCPFRHHDKLRNVYDFLENAHYAEPHTLGNIISGEDFQSHIDRRKYKYCFKWDEKNNKILRTFIDRQTIPDMYGVEREFNLSGMNLSWADLEGVDLSGVDLEYIELEGTNLSNANLKQTNLSYADLTAVNFSGADLEKTNFTGAELTYADFMESFPKKTKFDYSVLVGVKGMKTLKAKEAMCSFEWATFKLGV